MANPVPLTPIPPDDAMPRDVFGRPSLVDAVTPTGLRLRCRLCNALACPDCAGCHCTGRACQHSPHRCCGALS